MIATTALLRLDEDAAVAALRVGARSDEELMLLLDDLGPIVQQNPELASRLLRTVAHDANARGLSAVVARSSYLAARAELNEGHLDRALELIEHAEQTWLRAGAHFEALRTALGRMHVLGDGGRHREAAAVADRVIAQVDGGAVDGAAVEDLIWLRAAALENLGVSRGYLGEHEEALDAYAAAEAVYREHGWDRDLPRPMGNRGVELVELGRYEQALPVLRAAERGFAGLDDRLFAAQCLAYQARAELALGNFVGAAETTDRAEQHLSGMHATTEYARVQLVRAQTLTSLHLLQEAKALFAAIIAQFSAAGLQHDLAEALLGIGIVHARLGATGDAHGSFVSATELFEDVGDEAGRALAQLRRAEVARGDDAWLLASTASDTLRESGRAADYAAALLRLAQLADETSVAHERLDDMARILAARPVADLRWRLLRERARRHRQSGDDDSARATLQLAVDDIEAVRSTVGDEQDRLPFMSSRRRVHDDLIAVLLDLGDAHEAYAIAERERNRTLVERLSERSTSRLPNTSPASDTEDVARPAARRRRGEQNPSGHPGDPSPIVTYQILGGEILAFVDVAGAVRAERALTSTAALATMLARLDAQWRRFDDAALAARGQRHLLAATIDLLQELHRTLFAPLGPEVLGDTIVVVPTGGLANIPFAALHDGTSPLIERSVVTMAPSATAARHAAAVQRSGTRRLVLGVADEFAPRIVDEARAVAAAGSGSTLLIGADATVAALRAGCSHHDVIHLACHGVHRPDNPLFSGLRLGDRWLTAAEIATLQLDGQLVVLSACESGRQQSAGGSDELIGLPRAFLAAGASGVVVNLWRADDASAADLMTSFHRRLDRLNAAQALRRAQLDLRDRDPHPYRWAPAVLVGAPGDARDNA